MIILKTDKTCVLDAFDTVGEFKTYMASILKDFNEDAINHNEEPMVCVNAFDIAREFNFIVEFK